MEIMKNTIQIIICIRIDGKTYEALEPEVGDFKTRRISAFVVLEGPSDSTAGEIVGVNCSFVVSDSVAGSVSTSFETAPEKNDFF